MIQIASINQTKFEKLTANKYWRVILSNTNFFEILYNIILLVSKSTTYNTSICKSRAGQSHISYLQASAAVPADGFQFGF
jgi:hypothetical protein